MPENSGQGSLLAERIKAFQAEALPKMPPEFLEQALGNIQEMVTSGIAQRSVKVGDQAPDFGLPNVAGKNVTLSELLTQGPAVVAFYRGVW